MSISLAELKNHCRIDHSDEDDILERYLGAASDHVSAIGVDMSADPIPLAIEQAVLLLAAHFYENREVVGSGKEMPIAFHALVAPHREAIQ